ncbi:MAG: prepilin-type N-terminal cleavage/methylation domain-containing protein [Patescibacteria group bacterium]|nr:prepilin-type N-terminal cleavage/methylation domain-containing protein [Patescibacteria group bacterium]
MMNKPEASSPKPAARPQGDGWLQATNGKLQTGFTLIETMVAVSLLTVAIVAPMTLAARSLASALYARDQITAFYLAQEAIESVRAIRDSQILQIAQSASGSSIDIFGPLPLGDQPFTIDARKTDPAESIQSCPSTCPPLQTDGTLYGYESGWTNTNFVRVLRVALIAGTTDEVRVSVSVTWRTGGIAERTFTISSDLYRWVKDGSGVSS